MSNGNTKNPTNDEILKNFFDKHPNCNPDDKSFIGNAKVDCSKAGAHALQCNQPGPLGSKDSSACKQSQTIQLSSEISAIQSCKQNLYNSYASQSLSSAMSADNNFTDIFGNIDELFDNEMDLMDETLNTEIEIETYLSSVMVLLAIMIIIYFLFSKIIIY